MESRANYVLVGIFTLLLSAVAVIIPLWLASGLHQKNYTTYEVQMKESVDGLEDNAPVKYNGVDVGFVKKISLNPADTEEVILLLSIEENVPITTHTVAILQFHALTGVADLGLKGGSPIGAQPLLPLPGQPYPVIPSGPSLYARLDTALSSLMESMDTLSNHLNRTFSDQNQNALSDILRNLDKLTGNLAQHNGQINKAFSRFNRILQSFSQSSENVPETFSQLQILLNNLRDTTNAIRQNPGIILRGTALPIPGPGE